VPIPCKVAWQNGEAEQANDQTLESSFSTVVNTLAYPAIQCDHR
jgi:hypothetical protein